MTVVLPTHCRYVSMHYQRVAVRPHYPYFRYYCVITHRDYRYRVTDMLPRCCMTVVLPTHCRYVSLHYQRVAVRPRYPYFRYYCVITHRYFRYRVTGMLPRCCITVVLPTHCRYVSLHYQRVVVRHRYPYFRYYCGITHRY
jgi:hypothetical protein